MGNKELWERLTARNEGAKISYREPCIDEDDETWFWSSSNALRVHSRGTLYKDDVPLPQGGASRRQVFYRKRSHTFVEFSQYADGLFVTFARNNGAMARALLPLEQREDWIAYYRSLGFRRVGRWHVTPETVLIREFRDRSDKVVLRVDGNHVVERGEDTPCSSREAAESHAEDAMASLLQRGFRLHLMETARGRHDNPDELEPIELPKLEDYPAPTSANDAVDLAVAKLTELHQLFDRAHFVVEILDLPEDRARLEALGHDDFFIRMHKERIGRWRRTPQVDNAANSFEYFVQCYGSMTWIMSDTPDKLSCFYCGNVSGGGWSPLEVVADDYDTSCLDYIDPEMTRLHVFHGGWHNGYSYAFDTKYTSPQGEHPIVDFDEGCPELLEEEPDNIEPFGYWLLRRADELRAIVVPWLASMQ